MKTLRLFGMAIVAVMLAMPATSCDDDDDDDNTQIETTEDGIVTGQKKLIRITSRFEDSNDIEIDTILFTYDSKGRLSKLEEYGNDGQSYHDTDTYSWSDNEIKQYGSSTYTFTLSDNLVIAEEFADFLAKFEYNSGNRLTKFGYSESQERWKDYEYSWDGDRLIKVYEDSEFYTVYHYGGKTCKGYAPMNEAFESSIGYAHPELFGCRTNQLPDEEITYARGEEYQGVYSYTFYKDGYLESVTHESYGMKSVYFYFWE